MTALQKVATLEQKNKALRMKLYRSRKGVKNVKSSLGHMKSHKYISEHLSEVLVVSNNKIE